MDPIETIYTSLKENLSSGVIPSGGRLPSLRQLSDQYGVSRSTAWKAIRQLQADKLIHTKPRGAITAGQPTAEPALFLPGGFAWERLKAQIGRDIHTHVFSDNDLPKVNKLALQYGAAVNTLKKALASLVQEGLLVREGLKYRISHTHFAGRGSTMVFISFAEKEASSVSIGDPRTEQLVLAFERECQHFGYSARCEGFDPSRASGFLGFSTTIRSISNVAGFIVPMWNPGTREYWKRWHDLLRFLAGRAVPVVVIDLEGDLDFPQDILGLKNIRILRLAGIRAGEMVAEMLIRAGHRRVAFIAPSAHTTWAQRRYQGLYNYFNRYGTGTPVELFTTQENFDMTDMFLIALGLDKDRLACMFKDRYSKEQLRALIERLDKKEFTLLKSKLPIDRSIATVRPIAAFLSDLARKKLDQEIYDLFLETLFTAASHPPFRAYLKPFFKRMYETSTATVWVFADDHTAIKALEFLKKMGKKVPSDISVIGFDDWRESLAQGLSTYNFNMNGMIQQALLIILDEKTLKARQVISEVDGYVVERRTTRR
jgi:DNA-binding LacI/PurR family transcriptional regulator/DNA-binding transcriptional regulator YhcF (GntR family)